MKYFLMLIYDIDSIREGLVMCFEFCVIGVVVGVVWTASEWRSRWEVRHLPGLRRLQVQPRESLCENFDPTQYVGFASLWQAPLCSSGSPDVSYLAA